LLLLRDKCRDTIDGLEETDMKQQIVLALFVAVGMVVDTAARPHRADADQDRERLRIPDWLTVDLLIIGLGIVIVLVGVWIAP
jgi:hypothetical protein